MPPSAAAMSARRVTTVGQALPPMTAKERPPINVVGDVGGRIAIMVDDMIDDVKSFIDAALVLKDRYLGRRKKKSIMDSEHVYFMREGFTLPKF